MMSDPVYELYEYSGTDLSISEGILDINPSAENQTVQVLAYLTDSESEATVEIEIVNIQLPVEIAEDAPYYHIEIPEDSEEDINQNSID